MGSKIKSFTDLITWQKSHKLVLDIYKITLKFPEDEKYSLVSQLRRAAISITSNIAEGFSRRTSKDKAHFYYNALGSLTEIQNQLIIAKDLKYINESDSFIQNSIEINKLINSLIKKVESKQFSLNT